MNSVKILHTADLHIGARDAFLGTAAESRRFEALLTYERIVDLAKEKEGSNCQHALSHKKQENFRKTSIYA